MMKAPGSWSFRSAMAAVGGDEERRARTLMAPAFLKSHRPPEPRSFLGERRVFKARVQTPLANVSVKTQE